MALLSLRKGILLLEPRLRFPMPLQQRKKHGTVAAHLNENKEIVLVGGGNAAGYVAHVFVENGIADGRLCIVSKEKVAPYERPALSKAYLFPLDKNPARLPGFHTCVGSGWERQTPDWYKEKGIEVLYDTSVSGLDINSGTLSTSAGGTIKYSNLVIATGSTATRLPEAVGGHLPGVHYLREVEDADSLAASWQEASKVVVIGGGYIGMEVSAASVSWNLDTTVVFPEKHVMPRLFTPAIANRYEQFYESRGVKFEKGTSVKKLVAGTSGRVASVELTNGKVIVADTVIVGVGAKPNVIPFLQAGLKSLEGGIQVDGKFRTSAPGIFAIGDVAAFPLKIYGRTARVEHVDHARKSALHFANVLTHKTTELYDYLPFFYSRVFEYPGSERKLWWQFYGDNVGDTVEIGNFNPKYAAFWLVSGRIKGIFLESGSPEEFSLLPKIARNQPHIDHLKLRNASSVEGALEVAQEALESQSV